MYTNQIKYRLLENPHPMYGIRRDGAKWFIGNNPIKIKDNVLIVDKEKFQLTQGLVDLASSLENFWRPSLPPMFFSMISMLPSMFTFDVPSLN